MRFSTCGVVGATLAFVAPTVAQGLSKDLSASLDKYSTFSVFRSLLDNAPDSFDTALAKRTDDMTVFVPTDDAFQKYLTASGIQSVSDISSKDLEDFFAYHIADKALKGSDFSDQGGLVLPTLLEDEQYNIRDAGPQILNAYGQDATGQVLFATADTGSSKKLRRQSDTDKPSVTLRAGLAQDVGMTALDGTWGSDKNSTFQAINQVLTAPRPCSTTIRSTKSQLSSLDAALNKTGLYPTLDTTHNVTCLAPNTQAFKDAKSPEITLGKDDLTGALLAHTLKGVTYTNYLEDGQVIETFNNSTVTVHIRDGDIFFNNAKIIEANVLTNNGLIHILDAVIVPEDGTTKTGSSSIGTATQTSSPTTVPTSSQTHNAAGMLSVGYSGILALFAMIVVS